MQKFFILTFSLLVICFYSHSQNTFIKHYGEFSGQGNSLIINSSGNYVVGGTKNQGNDFKQFCMYQINAIGDTVWVKLCGLDSLEEIIQSKGWYQYSTVYIVKTNSFGNVSWTKQFGEVGEENATAISQINTGEYLIAGRSKYNSNGLFDFFMAKLNSLGDTIWTKKIGGTLNEECNSMKKTSDGGFILSGYSESFTHGSKDFYLVKTDNNGNVIWTNHYGGSSAEISKAVQQTLDGGYILTGYTQSFGVSSENMFVVKINSLGDTLWTKTYGHIGRNSCGNDLIQTIDGGYVITGNIETASPNGNLDLYLVKTDSNGNIQWEQEFKIEPTNLYFTSSEGRSITQLSDGSFVTAGYWFSGSTYQLLLIKTNNSGVVGLEEVYDVNNDVNVYPNPCKNLFNVQINNEIKNCEFILINALGQKVYQQKLRRGANELDINGFTMGLYNYILFDSNKQISRGKLSIE